MGRYSKINKRVGVKRTVESMSLHATYVPPQPFSAANRISVALAAAAAAITRGEARMIS